MTGIIVLMIIGLLSFLVFWKSNSIMFMVLGVGTFMSGFFMPDILDDLYLGITFAVVLWGYGLFCAGMSFRMMLWRSA